MDQLSLAQLAGYIDGRAGCPPLDRVEAFKKVREVIQGDARAVVAEGMSDVLEAARRVIAEGRKPWLARAVKLLCYVVCSEGASLLHSTERCSIAETLRHPLTGEPEGDIVNAVTLVLSSAGLRGPTDTPAAEDESAVFAAVIRSLLLPLPPKCPQHLHAAVKALGKIVRDPSAQRRTEACLSLWVPYCIHTLSFDTPSVLNATRSDGLEGPSASQCQMALQSEYSSAQREVMSILSEAMRRIPVDVVPNGSGEAAANVNAALRARCAFLKECTTNSGGDDDLLDKGLALWAVQAHFDGTIRDKSCRHEAEVNTLLSTMTNVLSRPQHVLKGLGAWKHLIASWTLHRAFLKKKYATILAYPLSAGRQRVWEAGRETRGVACRSWVLLLGTAMRRAMVGHPAAGVRASLSRHHAPTQEPNDALSDEWQQHLAVVTQGFLDAVLPLYRVVGNAAAAATATTTGNATTAVQQQRAPPRKVFPTELRPEESIVTILLLLESLCERRGAVGADGSSHVGLLTAPALAAAGFPSTASAALQAAQPGEGAGQDAAATPQPPPPASDFLSGFVRSLEAAGGAATTPPSPAGEPQQRQQPRADDTLSLLDGKGCGAAAPLPAQQALDGQQQQQRFPELRAEASLLLCLAAGRGGADGDSPFSSSPAAYLEGQCGNFSQDYLGLTGLHRRGGAGPEGAGLVMFGLAAAAAERLRACLAHLEATSSADAPDGAHLLRPGSLIATAWLLSKALSAKPLLDALRSAASPQRGAGASAPASAPQGTAPAPTSAVPQADAVSLLQDLAEASTRLPLLLRSSVVPGWGYARRHRAVRVVLDLLSPFFPLFLEMSPTDVSTAYGKQAFSNLLTETTAETDDLQAERGGDTPHQASPHPVSEAERRCLAGAAVAALCSAGSKATNKFQLILFGFESISEKVSAVPGPRATSSLLYTWEALWEEAAALLISEGAVGCPPAGASTAAPLAITSFFCKKKHYEPLLAAAVSLPTHLIPCLPEGSPLSPRVPDMMFAILPYIEAVYEGVRRDQQGSPVAGDACVSGHGVLHGQCRNAHVALHPTTALMQTTVLFRESVTGLREPDRRHHLLAFARHVAGVCPTEYASLSSQANPNPSDAAAALRAVAVVRGQEANLGILGEEAGGGDLEAYPQQQPQQPSDGEDPIHIAMRRFIRSVNAGPQRSRLGWIPQGLCLPEAEPQLFGMPAVPAAAARPGGSRGPLLDILFAAVGECDVSKQHNLSLNIAAKSAQALAELSEPPGGGAPRATRIARHAPEVLDLLGAIRGCFVGPPLAQPAGSATGTPPWGIAAANREAGLPQGGCLLAALQHPAGALCGGPRGGDAPFAHLALAAACFAAVVPKMSALLGVCREYLLRAAAPPSGATPAATKRRRRLVDDDDSDEDGEGDGGATTASGELRCKAVQDTAGDALRDICLLLEESQSLQGAVSAAQQACGASPPGTRRKQPGGETGARVLPDTPLTLAALRAALDSENPGKSALQMHLLGYLLGSIVEALLKSGALHVAGYAVRLWERSVGQLTDDQASALGMCYSKGLASSLKAASKAAGKVIRLPGLTPQAAAPPPPPPPPSDGDGATTSNANPAGGVICTLERPLSPTLQIPTDSQTVLPATPPQPTGAVYRASFGRARPGAVRKQAALQGVTAMPPPSPKPEQHPVGSTTNATAERKRPREAADEPEEAQGGAQSGGAACMPGKKKARGSAAGAPPPPPPPPPAIPDPDATPARFHLPADAEHFFPELTGCADPLFALGAAEAGGQGLLPGQLWCASSGCPVDVSTVGDLASLNPGRAKKLLRSVPQAQRLLAEHAAAIESRAAALRREKEEREIHHEVFSVPPEEDDDIDAAQEMTAQEPPGGDAEMGGGGAEQEVGRVKGVKFVTPRHGTVRGCGASPEGASQECIPAPEQAASVFVGRRRRRRLKRVFDDLSESEDAEGLDEDPDDPDTTADAQQQQQGGPAEADEQEEVGHGLPAANPNRPDGEEACSAPLVAVEQRVASLAAVVDPAAEQVVAPRGASSEGAVGWTGCDWLEDARQSLVESLRTAGGAATAEARMRLYALLCADMAGVLMEGAPRQPQPQPPPAADPLRFLQSCPASPPLDPCRGAAAPQGGGGDSIPLLAAHSQAQAPPPRDTHSNSVAPFAPLPTLPGRATVSHGSVP